ncbi:MAG: shikimate kinase [Eikenella sp.]|nr:shikimate kinase [Eikenella sp.]
MPAMEHIAGNIFLIGLMGAGKTTQGKRLASLLCYPFVDSDQEIVQRTGVSIATIFELEGEDGFRNRETAVIEELSRRTPLVLATGGGAVLRKENRGYLKTRGTAVYLHATPEVLYQRIKADKSRPLLQVADPLAKLTELYRQRDPIYRSIAHIVVNVAANQPCRQATRDLLQQLKQYLASTP